MSTQGQSIQNLFQQGGDADFEDAPVAAAGQNAPQAHVRSVNAGAVLAGNKRRGRDMRLFGNFDVSRGMANNPGWQVDKADRLMPDQAKEALDGIMAMFGLASADEGIVWATFEAICACHTFNSGSTLTPDRCRIRVEGAEPQDFRAIISYLGTDLRRFFRAFADEVRRVNKKILKEYSITDPVKAEKYDFLMQVAYERGTQRYPDLAHDTSDCCSGLTPDEFSAIQSSKRFVLANSVNTADSLRANGRVLDASKYNSTKGGSDEAHAYSDTVSR